VRGVVVGPSIQQRESDAWADSHSINRRHRPRRWDATRPDYVPIDHFAFAPFSLGERSCIGRRFGQVVVLAALAVRKRMNEIDHGHHGLMYVASTTNTPPHHPGQMLLRDFDVSVPPGTDQATFLEPKQMLTLAPAHGSRLVFTHRRRNRR
jgi:cytochrome P450